MTWLLRLFICFSTDEQVRALRDSNDRLASLLAESYCARGQLNAVNQHLSAALMRASHERDQKAAELAMMLGHQAGQPIGQA